MEAELNVNRCTDDKLVGLLCKTPNAFWELFERHHQSTFRYLAVTTGGDLEQALHITAKAFWIMLRRQSTYRRAGFASWFFGITWDVINDQRRDAETQGQESGNSTNGVSKQGPASLSAELQRALMNLRTISFYPREALYLRFFAGMNTKDIGIMMDRSESQIEMLVFQAVHLFHDQKSACQGFKSSKERLAALAESYHFYLTDVLAEVTPQQIIPEIYIQATDQLKILHEALSIPHELRLTLAESLQKMISSSSRNAQRL